MKKSILIISTALITLSLTAFGIINWNGTETDPNNPSIDESISDSTIAKDKVQKRIYTDFIYDVGPRFGAIKKGDLNMARSFSDFLDEDHNQRIESYHSLKVIRMIGDRRSYTIEINASGVFTPEQLTMLKSFDHSTNFLIQADYLERNEETGKLEFNYSTPHLTVVPETQARYESGRVGIMTFLIENTREIIADVDAEKLQPAKLYFTVTKGGTIENIKLDRPSGYPLIDQHMIELISTAPGAWEPAKNAKGKKVDQELVVSFGLMGC